MELPKVDERKIRTSLEYKKAPIMKVLGEVMDEHLQKTGREPFSAKGQTENEQIDPPTSAALSSR